ncbi:hypothetical protein A1D29_00130 [Pasteurellaceae bacterium Orientalotternb1]|nr:hypothetical protein A1D29_00130 [Pasteurellaceae bacterium Orientalotternb1]
MRIILLFTALVLGSFSDEAVQLIFFLKLGNVEKIYLISLLFLGGMAGGMLANIYFSRLLSRISLKSVLIGSLISQSVLILITSQISNEIGFLMIAFILGILGSLLWSAVMVAIPSLSNNHNELEKINKYAHTIRNMGFMTGPALGGILFDYLGMNSAVLLIGLLTFSSALVFLFVLEQINFEKVEAESSAYLNGISAIRYLFQDNVIKKALSPIIFTVIFTSATSAILVVYLTNVVNLTGEQYGVYSSLFSLSLALSPILLTNLFRQLGEASGAAFCATLIGLGQLITGLNHHYFILLFAGILIGSANGIHNTLLSAFMLKQIAPENRKNYLPAYGLLLQSCAATGFIISLFITASVMQSSLMIFGMLSMLFGLFGVWLNRKG